MAAGGVLPHLTVLLPCATIKERETASFGELGEEPL